ncbi:hypothetical protein DENSPDRAFT_681657 [Dentipellis sp. KUC8613]|nr:hypothetical protein DENSPDRAFT_681657 [Dentipellis sp. KUC8613]
MPVASLSCSAMSPRSLRPMIERKLNNQASMLSRQNTYGGQYPNMDNGYGNDYGAMGHSSFQSFSPGEYVTSPTMTSPPITATSANPFISPYAQDVLPSPTFDQVSYPQAAITRQPSGQYVTRQPSMNGASPFSPVTPATMNIPEDDPHYVDLSRSSVSPYQAAQYAEISRKLGAPPPAPLVLGAVPEEQQLQPPPSALTAASYAPDAGLTSHLSMPPAPENANPESPFADPGMYDSAHPVPSRKEYTPHVNSMASANGSIHARTKSNPGDPVTDADMADDAQELEFPEPPAMADSAHQRVDSTPPQLPEIMLQQRAFSPVSYDFPIPHSVGATPSSFNTEFGGDVHGNNNISQSRSPLAMHSPLQGEAAEQPQQQQRPNAGAKAQEKRPMSTATTYTVYDDEDAYGGI